MRTAPLITGLWCTIQTVWGLWAPVWAEHRFCAELIDTQLHGKRVVVRVAGGEQPERIEGVIVKIGSELLVVQPGAEPAPLYERGKLVEPNRGRIYLNCAYIQSVVLGEGDQATSSQATP